VLYQAEPLPDFMMDTRRNARALNGKR
jgi:hypothetical protein